jgi:hypothetical protein
MIRYEYIKEELLIIMHVWEEKKSFLKMVKGIAAC